MVTGLDTATTLTVLYDRDCGICTATARALVSLDRARRLQFEPLQTTRLTSSVSRAQLAESLHVLDAAGRWFSGGQATAEIARRVPALLPVAVVARLPGAMLVLDVWYRIVADNRHRLSALLGLRVCAVPAHRA